MSFSINICIFYIQSNFHLFFRFIIKISAPEVLIVDELAQPLVAKYYEVDSTIELTCIVRHVSMLSSTVYWLHGDQMLNFDMTRGGIR